MNLSEVISYLFSLRYPGAEDPRGNLVCYQGFSQVVIPVLPSGRTIRYTVRPQYGTFAFLGYIRMIGSDMVPNSFSYVMEIAGTIPMGGTITQVNRDMEHPGYMLITEREPLTITATNISPLAQRGEMLGLGVVIPTVKDLETINDALRRLHTSTESERLLQQAAYLLGVLTGQPLEPRPPIGGS